VEAMANRGTGASSKPGASRGMGRRLIGQFFRAGEVTEVSRIDGRMRRVTMAVPALEGVPGQQVRVCVGDVISPASWLDGLRRTYSVWDYDSGLMSLCILDHGDGPGARWARSVRPGHEICSASPRAPWSFARPPTTSSPARRPPPSRSGR
jgi:NADPH-dependent ferric siderophore reductase